MPSPRSILRQIFFRGVKFSMAPPKRDAKSPHKRDASGRLLPLPAGTKKQMGRPKGALNKINADIRMMIHEALHGVGGVEYLMDQAVENPRAFLPLLARIIPQEHKLSLGLGEELVGLLQDRRDQLSALREPVIEVDA